VDDDFKKKGSVAQEYLVLKVIFKFFIFSNLSFSLQGVCTRYEKYILTHISHRIIMSIGILFINHEECGMVLYTMIKGPLLTVV
jgi:hypothetical protein